MARRYRVVLVGANLVGTDVSGLGAGAVSIKGDTCQLVLRVSLSVEASHALQLQLAAIP